MEEITKNIFRLTLPYKDIFTTVYIIKSDNGNILFAVGIDVVSLILWLNDQFARQTEQTFALVFVVNETFADFLNCNINP